MDRIKSAFSSSQILHILKLLILKNTLTYIVCKMCFRRINRISNLLPVRVSNDLFVTYVCTYTKILTIGVALS